MASPSTRARASLAALLLGPTACATAKLAGAPPPCPPDPGAARTVVLEPLFETAEWKTTVKTEYAEVMGASDPRLGFGSPLSGGLPQTVAVTREVAEKPLFAKVEVLAAIHRQLLPAVQALRPSWRVTSTGGAPLLEGPVAVVRTIIAGNGVVASDRGLKSAAFGFGLVLWPLLYLAGQPVEETQRVVGALERYAVDGAALRGRLVRYPSQPDYAVNLAGVPPLRHEFGLDVSYLEGLMASELPRTAVLIQGFVQRLAVAVVAIVEEADVPPQPPPPPP